VDGVGSKADALNRRVDRRSDLRRKVVRTQIGPAKSILERLLVRQAIGVLRVALEATRNVLRLKTQEITECRIVAFEEVLQHRAGSAESRARRNGSCAGAAAS
jgi:hypothetical protein